MKFDKNPLAVEQNNYRTVNCNKEKHVYNGYGIIFDSGAGSRSFCNDLPRNVVILGVDNSSSSHADIYKNIFLVLSEGPPYGINGSFGLPEKSFIIN